MIKIYSYLLMLTDGGSAQAEYVAHTKVIYFVLQENKSRYVFDVVNCQLQWRIKDFKY